MATNMRMVSGGQRLLARSQVMQVRGGHPAGHYS
jgi:hypothetical protein